MIGYLSIAWNRWTWRVWHGWKMNMLFIFFLQLRDGSKPIQGLSHVLSWVLIECHVICSMDQGAFRKSCDSRINKRFTYCKVPTSRYLFHHFWIFLLRYYIDVPMSSTTHNLFKKFPLGVRSYDEVQENLWNQLCFKILCKSFPIFLFSNLNSNSYIFGSKLVSCAFSL
jgi:hypothetical protein